MAQNLTFNLAVDTNSAVSSINQFFSAFDSGATKAKNQLNQAFGQTLQTSVQINLKDGELVAKKIQNINQESKKLETAVNAINGKWAKTPNELKRQLTMLKQIQGDTAKYNKETGKISSDWQKVTQRIREASSELKKMTQGGAFAQMKNELTGIVGKFAAVQTIANLATGAIMGMARGVGDFAATAQRMEVLNLQLEAFTGSAEEAGRTFDEFVRIAADSPFNLEQVAQAGKIMMAFGVDTDTAVKSTEQLGIVAAATGGDINLLARNLGQIAAQGQAYTRDLTQFAIQGIPIWEEMSRVTGKTVQELKEMAREGQISFAIVKDALQNLTAEGTAFAEVAARMQETFQGRMARIEAAVQKLATEFINTFNKMDRFMGNMVSGSMKLFADAIFAIAKNLDTIATALAAVTAATAVYIAVSNFGNIIQGIRVLAGVIKGILTWQNLLNVATIAFHALTGNWAAIAAAAGAGAIAYAGVSAAMDKARQEAEGLNQEALAATESTGELSEAQLALAEQAGDQFDEMIEDYKELKGKMDEKKAALDAEVEVLKALRDQVKEKYDAEIQGIKDTVEEDRIKQEEMKQNHRDRLDEVKARYDAELDLIDLAIGRLREKTTEEQKLYDFEKKQLQEKIKSGTLDEEALLRAQARLSRMERQEKIQELLKDKTAKQAEKEKEIAEAKKEHNTQMKALSDKIKSQEADIRALEQARDDEIGKIDKTIQNIDLMTDGIDLTNVSVNQQISLVNQLAGEYATAKAQVDRLAASLRQAATEQRTLNAAQNSSSSSSGNSGARASGGPVSGGSTYTVNELGREAFLSASGKLSMINAPAFGDWKAPGAGTVIPAHLTKQLNIPTGGVNLNSAAVSNASRAGSGGMGSMIKAIRGAMSGGDTFHQNVTVQSANPTQTANNMMVEMTRLRRRRFG